MYYIPQIVLSNGQCNGLQHIANNLLYVIVEYDNYTSQDSQHTLHVVILKFKKGVGIAIKVRKQVAS